MNKHFIHEKIHDINSEIEFQVLGKERIGVVKEIHFEKDRENRKWLWYLVEDSNGSGKEYNIDGELFQIM